MTVRRMIAALLAVLFAVAGCSSTSEDAHNAADVTFAQDMVPHHRQAVEMADMALTAASDRRVIALAQAIKAAQSPEIDQMTGWLTGWKDAVPTGMAGMGGAPGMMSDAEMAALDKATGTAFDRLWVQMMTAHHQGALTMANTELSAGQYQPATRLAQSIVTTQTAQIAQLTSLAAELPA